MTNEQIMTELLMKFKKWDREWYSHSGYPPPKLLTDKEFVAKLCKEYEIKKKL